MKLKVRLIAVILSVVLILAAFPMGAGAAQYSSCNRAQFIMDVTVRDGSRFDPGDTFTKTWRLRNTGSCTWDTNYALVFDSGEDFGVTSPQKLTAPVLPWSYVDLTVTMTAPTTPGKHRSSWKLEDGSANRFGVGWGGGVPIFALINVVTPPSVTYDFTTKAAGAIWTSGFGALTFPGTVGDPNGSALELATPKFENGVTASTSGLVVSPNNVNNGFIQGFYNENYTVKKGDRFQTTVGCEFGQNSCYVAFSLKYQIGSGPIYTLWTFRERYEGLTYNANINLDRLAGKTVNFILYMSAYGSPVGDSAIWGHPVIVGTGAPGGSPGGSTAGWNTFTHISPEVFAFKFPQSAFISSDGSIRLSHTTSGTNLEEKKLDVNVGVPNSSGECKSPHAGSTSSTPVTINGIEFTKEKGNDPAASPRDSAWVAYSTKHTFGSTEKCVSISLTLISDPTRSPAYNFDSEAAILDTIISTLTYSSGA